MKTVIFGLIVMFAVLGGVYYVMNGDNTPASAPTTVSPVGNLKIN